MGEEQTVVRTRADLFWIGLAVGMLIAAILSSSFLVTKTSVAYKAGFKDAMIDKDETIKTMCYSGCNIADRLVNEMNISSILKDDFDKDMEFLSVCVARCRE